MADLGQLAVEVEVVAGVEKEVEVAVVAELAVEEQAVAGLW